MNPGTPKNPTTPTGPAAPAVLDAEETAAEENTAKDAAYSLDKGAAEAEGEPAVADGAGAGSAPDPAQDLDADAVFKDSDDDSDFTDPDFDDSGKESSGLASAAAAVAATGLGVVALSGSWTGKVAAERETLIGQIKTSGGGTAAQQISEIYGDAWHSTALVNGLFALLALLVGVFALVRPAFGAPSPHPQPGWVRAVATAGIALGVLGLVISAGMYFDLIVALPTAGITK
ncbi:hypothetical protein [Streptomyces sp. Ncost-T10-10d]|uniref:hypothetical protein n=1 Tax=Streptomyces sp. Ncost-T10-10d TaxID=1839774 RepID=UPI00081E664A|nr:hypothetical protein [Streptomyces sp. Ncost-T10-10d]SCF80935.1 hypothetical protein GA0115254_117711 [Streptomyces sp. Ncost-T10-10d]